MSDLAECAALVTFAVVLNAGERLVWNSHGLVRSHGWTRGPFDPMENALLCAMLIVAVFVAGVADLG